MQVCPTGIDIRNGLQYECIACAACIDACNQVMDKMGYPRGLIRYTTENAMANHWDRAQTIRRALRPRVLIYGVILIVVASVLFWKIATRPDVRVDVMRDRASLAREIRGGWIENVYTLNIMNMVERPRRFTLTVGGLPNLKLEGPAEFDVPPATTLPLTVQVQAPAGTAPAGTHKIYFEVKVVGEPENVTRELATFIIPE